MSRGQGRVFRPKWTDPATRAAGVSPTWWLDYSVNGKRHRESAHTKSRREACDLLRERIGDRQAGKLTGAPDRVTFIELREGLERHYQREGNRSLKRVKQALNHLQKFFGDSRALEITRPRVSAYVAQRLDAGAARGTARYEVAVLNTAFSVAVQEDEVLSMRPMFKLPAAGAARRGFFDEGDFAALVLELPEAVRPIVRFLRLTGWRLSEVLGLSWDQVDWEGQVVSQSADDTKGGAAPTFPFGLAPELKGILEARWAARDGLFVFHRAGKPVRGFRRAWARACAKAGLAGRLVHDLRRSAARDLRRAGVSEGEIMRLCGWKTRAMFDRYNIIDEADLARAVAKRFNGKGAAKEPTPVPRGGSLSSSPAIEAA